MMCPECARLGRRHLLSLAGLAAAAGVAAVAARPRPALARTTLAADEALAKLKAGNDRFVAAPQLCAANLANNRTAVAPAQSPWATVLTCSDSRLPPELIFGGLGLGELFVTRTAGNVADPAVVGTIEYGAEHLGSPLVVVMGHNRCGAVQAACAQVQKPSPLPGSIGVLVDQIVPAARAELGKPGDFIENVVRANARLTAERIGHDSPVVHELAHEGKVKVVAARYDLDSGRVEFLG
ncbi:carbonic anhydrase [Enhydrobacter aerosaccus]|uniref:carbonic anhydrase n=1 Tax=Enhydrobacter aerosaccus TaxID=225324 RepID=A0A1T4JUA6_9HYPH|nr:carbonic anhydrase [Enhydrobacter aerosaccus]SJZ33714.1 carbonic anhydrase [Enhydrobacter aerosaccus]